MYSEADLIEEFPYHELDKGRRYLRQGRVRSATLSPDATRASGQVQGTQRKPYDVTIRIRYEQSRRGRIKASFSGLCSCPLGGYCKHVIAVLLDLVEPRPVPAPRPAAVSAVAEDKPLLDWLEKLDRVAAPGYTPDAYPSDVKHRAIYVIAANERPGAAMVVKPQTVLLLKSGEPGSSNAAIRASNLQNRVPPKHLRETDKILLRLLWSMHTAASGAYAHDDGTYALAGDMANEILRLIIETGRGRWRDIRGPVLRKGPARPGHAEWRVDDAGTQRFRLTAGDDGTHILPLAQLTYLDPVTGEIGPVETDISPHVLPVLLAAPPVPAAAANRLRRALAEKLPGRAALLPQEIGATIINAVDPTPCLRLFRRGDLDISPYGKYIGLDEFAEANLCAELSFDYDGTIIVPDDPRNEVSRLTPQGLLVTPRQRNAEAAAASHLAGLGFFHLGGPGNILVNLPDEDDPHWVGGEQNVLLAFLHYRVPELRAAGWRVDIDDSIAWEIADLAEDGWVAEVDSGGSGIDWFGLSLGVMADGQRIDLLPVLLPLLKALPESGDLGPLEELAEADGVFFAHIEGKRVLPLPMARIKPLLIALYELYRVGGIGDDGAIKLTAARAAELVEMAAAAAAAGLRWFGGEKLLETGRRLKDFSGIETIPTPTGLVGGLRPYQQDGVNWLQFLRGFDFGGILADDMGLGKTIQTLTHLLVEQESGRLDRPALVIAPTSLMVNWRLEAARFAPSLRVLTLHGLGRKADFEHIGDYDLVLTTYPLLPRDKAVLLGRDWHFLILDEAQIIKNPKAQASLIAQQIRARHRLCLTGTPMENNLGELWALFHFLQPGLLGDQKQFQRLFRTPIEKLGDSRRQQDLARRIRPFMLRRTKAQVAADLPDKTEIIEHIELDQAQRDLYESIRLAMDAKVRAEVSAKGLARSHIIILDALLKLRQVCCDPQLVKLTAAARVQESAKLTRLMEMLPELIADGRRILLFSQFTTMLGLIEAELTKAGITYVKLTGQTKDRQTPVEKFQAGAVPVFLISLKAGGTGLNLTAADTVIHYDPWWNPAAERQATDRAHRIGQDKAVFVYKLVTVGTVETAILELQARKQALADGLYDPETGQGAMLTEADLASLFAPLT